MFAEVKRKTQESCEVHKDTAREGIAIRVTLGVLGVRTRGSSPSPLTAPRHVIKQRGGA